MLFQVNILLIIKKEKENVYGFGDNEYGQLGIENEDKIKIPTLIPFLSNNKNFEIYTNSWHLLLESLKLIILDCNCWLSRIS